MPPVHMRTLVIIAGLALPVVALALVTQFSPPKPAKSIPSSVQPSMSAVRPGASSSAPARLPSTTGIATDNPAPPATLTEARNRVRQRIDHLDSISPEQWREEKKARKASNPNARVAATLAEARENARNYLSQLNMMTEEEFQQRRQKSQASRQWNQLTPQERLKFLEAQPASGGATRSEGSSALPGTAPAAE